MSDSATTDVDTFGFRTCLSSAWAIVRDHWFALVVALFLSHVLPIVAFGLVFVAFVDQSSWAFSLALAAGWITAGALQAGYLKFCLNLCTTGQWQWKDLFSAWPFAFQMIVATTCYWALLALGYYLLIVPGVFLTVRLAFYGIALVDQHLLPLRSLEVSNRLQKGYAWYTAGFLLVCWAADRIFMLPAVLTPLGLRNFPATLSGFGGTFQPLLIICLCILYRHIRTRPGEPK